MAIITFWSNTEKETGQTLTAAAVATNMAIEHNFRILLLSTTIDKTIENCFWDLTSQDNLSKQIVGTNRVGIGNGLEGLVRAAESGKATSDTIPDYTKPVFKERLEVLPSYSGNSTEEFIKIRKKFIDIIKIASGYYDYIIVDIDKRITADMKKILDISDVVVVNLKQSKRILDSYIKNKSKISEKKSIIPVLTKYDKRSKFTIKNVSRYLKEEIFKVPYNTLFFETSEEGQMADYFLKMRRARPEDENAILIDDVKKITDKIIYKVEEKKMRR